MSYLTYNEALEFTGLTLQKFAELVKSGQLKNTKRKGVKYFFLEEDLIEYKVFIPRSEEYYSLDEVSKILDINKTNIIQNYIPKKIFQDVVQYKKKFYISKTEVDNLLQLHLDFVNKEGMITSQEAANILEIQHDTFLNMIAHNKFKNVIKDIYLVSKWKVDLNEVLEFKTEKEKRIQKLKPKIKNPYSKNIKYVGMRELVQYFNLSDFHIRKAIKQKVFSTHVRFNKLHYVEREEMLAISNLEELIYTPYELFLKSSNRNEDLINYLLTFENKDLIFNTISLFNEYYLLKVNSSGYKNKSSFESKLVFSFSNLSKLLNKELYLYTDYEIEQILGHDSLNNSIKQPLIGFINYVSNAVEECSYKNKYNFTSKPNKSNSKDIYSKEEYFKLHDFLSDIEKHKNKAIHNEKYASTWFYCLVHLCNAWRSGDILDFPRIDELKNIVPTNEYLLKNNLSLEESQFIINTVQSNWERFFIHKTGGLNKFHVNLSLLIPIATVLSILINHNSEEFICLTENSIKRHLNPFFKELSFDFSSLKMNRSFLTYFFESTSKGSKNGDISNLLSTKLRGHRDDNTLQNYIMNVNEDGFSENISYNLFKRGHFGWLYHSLIDIVTSHKELNFEEKTLLIETYQKFYSPKEVEYLSEFFLLQQNKNKSIAMEIAMLPNDELKSKLEYIFKGKMPSKELDSQCLFSGNCKNPSGECFTCPFLVPRVYLLSSLKSEIMQIANNLKDLNEYETHDRIKYSFILFKLLNLLQQSVETYGKEYVNTYLSLKELQLELKKVDNKILIQHKSREVD